MGGSRLLTADPETLPDGRWSEGEFDAAGASVGAPDSSPPSLGHPDHGDVGIRLTLYPAVAWMGRVVCVGRRLDFAGNAYPALTRTPSEREIALHFWEFRLRFQWWAHKDSRAPNRPKL
jgi:hypothetical protein